MNIQLSLVERISEEIKAEIRDLYFSGKSWNEISSKTGAGKGTVQGIVNTLYDIHGKEKIKNTIEAIRAIKNAGVTTTDAISSARIHGIVKKMKLDDDNLFKFVSTIYTSFQKNNLDPSKLVELASQLFDIKSQSKIPLEEIPSHIATLQKEKKRLEGEVLHLNQEKQNAIQKRESELKRLEITHKELDDYTKTKKSLQEFGAEIGDLQRLENLLRQISDLNYDAAKLVKYSSQEENFENRKQDLQGEIKDLQSQIQQREQKLKTLLTEEETTSGKIEALKARHLVISDSVSSVEKIKQKGLDPLRIVHWEQILNSCGTTPYGFEEQIKEYGKLQNLLADIRKNIAKSEREKISLQSKVDTLSKEKNTVESSLLQTREMTLKILDGAQKKVSDVISGLESSASKSIEQTRNDSIKKINDATDITSSKLSDSAKTFEEMIADISIKSEQFGKLSSITPLYELVVETKGEPTRVLLSVHTLLQRFLSWLDKNPKQNNVKSSAQSLKTVIERNLGH